MIGCHAREYRKREVERDKRERRVVEYEQAKAIFPEMQEVWRIGLKRLRFWDSLPKRQGPGRLVRLNP